MRLRKSKLKGILREKVTTVFSSVVRHCEDVSFYYLVSFFRIFFSIVIVINYVLFLLLL